MIRSSRLMLLLAVFLLPAVASAQHFTVTMANGTAFETRDRPIAAEWDDSLVMIRTDQGNWIGLERADIVDVVSEAEVTGFGYRVDTATLFVGFSPNDLIDDAGEDGNEERINEEEDGIFDVDSGYYVPEDPADTGFTIQQFVDPGETGQVKFDPDVVINTNSPSGRNRG